MHYRPQGKIKFLFDQGLSSSSVNSMTQLVKNCISCLLLLDHTTGYSVVSFLFCFVFLIPVGTQYGSFYNGLLVLMRQPSFRRSNFLFCYEQGLNLSSPIQYRHQEIADAVPLSLLNCSNLIKSTKQSNKIGIFIWAINSLSRMILVK